MKNNMKRFGHKIGSYNNLLREKKILEKEQSKIKTLMNIEKMKKKNESN